MTRCRGWFKLDDCRWGKVEGNYRLEVAPHFEYGWWYLYDGDALVKRGEVTGPSEFPHSSAAQRDIIIRKTKKMADRALRHEKNRAMRKKWSPFI